MSNKKAIPFFNYPALFKEHEADYVSIFKEVCSRGAYIMQRDLGELEKQLQEFLSVKHAIGVADGTNAIVLVLKALDLKPSDEVILASHTYVATAAAVHLAGAKPVLVDCGPDHMIDPESVRRAITANTRIILPTQLNGRTADMDKLQAIADEYKLTVVEDAAQALGSQYRGRCAGTFGIAGTYSFYPAKLLGCFGDGGAVVTNDDAMARKVRLMRDHGRDETGEVVTWGTNARLDNLQAAVLSYKLKTFSKDIEYRRKLASEYATGLKNLSQIKLPPSPGEDSRHFDVYQNYEIEAERRDELKSFLEQQGVRSIIQWGGKAVHQLQGLGLNHFDLPYTERMFKKCMLLPMNTSLAVDDIRYIAESIKAFYAS